MYSSHIVSHAPRIPRPGLGGPLPEVIREYAAELSSLLDDICNLIKIDVLEVSFFCRLDVDDLDLPVLLIHGSLHTVERISPISIPA